MLSLVIIAEHHGLRAINIAAVAGHGLVPRLLEVRKFDHSPVAPAGARVESRSFWRSLWFSHALGASLAKKREPIAVEETAQEIEYVLDRYQPEHWGLAAPGDCVERLLGQLSQDCRSNLGPVVDRDLSRAEAADVLEEFLEYHPAA